MKGYKAFYKGYKDFEYKYNQKINIFEGEMRFLDNNGYVHDGCFNFSKELKSVFEFFPGYHSSFPPLDTFVCEVKVDNVSEITHNNEMLCSQLSIVCKLSKKQIYRILKKELGSDLDIVKRHKYFIYYIKNPSEEVQLHVVTMTTGFLPFLKNPSIKVQKHALYYFGEAIKFIRKPTKEIQLYAVDSHCRAIKYIERPCKEAQLLAVKYCPDIIYCIDDPCDEIKMLIEKRKGKNKNL